MTAALLCAVVSSRVSCISFPTTTASLGLLLAGPYKGSRVNSLAKFAVSIAVVCLALGAKGGSICLACNDRQFIDVKKEWFFKAKTLLAPKRKFGSRVKKPLINDCAF